MSDTTNLTLSQAFAKAQSGYNQISNSTLPSNNSKYQAIEETIKLLDYCKDRIRQLALFSSNETAEDYSTSELKYLLTDAYLGQVVGKKTGGNRRAIIEQCIDCFTEYLNNCNNLDMVIKEDQELFKRLIKDQGDKTKMDPAKRRQVKIDRHKRRAMTKKAIEDIEEKIKIRANEPAAPAGKEGDEVDLGSEDIEELERKVYTRLIDLNIQISLDELSSCFEEMEMVKHMERMMVENQKDPDSRMDKNKKISPGKDGYEEDWRIEPKGPLSGGSNSLLDKKGKPMQPFVLVSKKETIKQGVFRPGWALPTMTIDEYLEEEHRRGNIISGGGEKSGADPEPIDDNDHDALDAETMKERKWDDFKDDNPRGAGNRMHKG
ncbi:Type 2A phosphatase-associated protein 42 [Mycoemilia scoparia]|uniref:Type 2A phosphatase-associated protein 42 n=1 Tax=Mycoemilia scoparia TaxID=417184 RepID=A0A9W8DN10_9FUNG|nr:Type 2A phosphatase-associated protein 42 [Mycoemilia scoparia]